MEKADEMEKADGERTVELHPTPAPAFRMRRERAAGREAVRLEGELDFASAKSLVSAMEESIAGDAKAIDVDLSQLQFIDSAGIGALLEIAERSRADGNRLLIGKPRGYVARILRLTGVDVHLPLA